jgi:hypothetical protein
MSHILISAVVQCMVYHLILVVATCVQVSARPGCEFQLGAQVTFKQAHDALDIGHLATPGEGTTLKPIWCVYSRLGCLATHLRREEPGEHT